MAVCELCGWESDLPSPRWLITDGLCVCALCIAKEVYKYETKVSEKKSKSMHVGPHKNAYANKKRKI